MAEMLGILEVVEELVATAYERGTKTISLSQIKRQLYSVGHYSTQNVEGVLESLSDLGYCVTKARKFRLQEHRAQSLPSSSK